MNITRLLLFVLASTSLLIPTLSVMAVPARPGLTVITQSDGTTLEVRIAGDEYYHLYTTSDGIPLVEDGDKLCYATIDASGMVVSTGVPACNVEQRSAEELKLVSEINTEAVRGVMEKKSKEALYKVQRRGPGLFAGSHFPATGEHKALVLLVQYSDVKFTLDDPYDYFSRLLNEEGFNESGATGSARDYFIESSMGVFQPQFDVYGPITLSRPRSYYGGNNWYGSDARAWLMALEAVEQLDAEVDFSEYDRDGDGRIDNVFIFFAGMGEHAGGGAECVWPHASYVTYSDSEPHIYDGVQLDSYGCTSEWMIDRPDGIGTFCHEFGHILGLPDLYATSYTEAFTLGSWAVMDMGAYNNDSRTPPLHSAFERYALGWIEPRQLTAASDVELLPISSNDAGIIKAGKNEYFLFENRQQTGWDQFLPGHGMLITHVLLDEAAWASNRVNNDPDMMLVDIEEADGIATEDTRAGDAFPGTAGVTSFTDDTTPSMRNWNNQRLSLPITDITETDGIIRFKVAGGARHISVPVILDPTDITPEGFTLHWEKVGEATDYRLAIFGDDMTPIEGYDAILTGDTDSYKVSGLIPDTDYCYTLTAIDADGFESLESEVYKIATALPTFEYKSVEIFEPEALTANSWRASWSLLDEADDYELTVMTMGEGRPYEYICPFDDGVKILPEGWTTNCTLTYANVAYSGISVPSVKMGVDGCYVESPMTDADIRSISFWHRGVSSAPENIIRVEGLIDSRWQTLGEYDVTNDAPGEIISLSDIPAYTRAVRISAVLKGKGAIALDDVTVLWGARTELVAIPGFDALRTGGATDMTVEVNDPGIEYQYFVTALCGSRRSLPSRMVAYRPSVSLSDVSGDASPVISVINNVIKISAARDTHWSVTDTTGITVAAGVATGDTPTVVSLSVSGMYIVRVGDQTRCIIVK